MSMNGQQSKPVYPVLEEGGCFSLFFVTLPNSRADSETLTQIMPGHLLAVDLGTPSLVGNVLLSHHMLILFRVSFSNTGSRDRRYRGNPVGLHDLEAWFQCGERTLGWLGLISSWSSPFQSSPQVDWTTCGGILCMH